MVSLPDKPANVSLWLTVFSKKRTLPRPERGGGQGPFFGGPGRACRERLCVRRSVFSGPIMPIPTVCPSCCKKLSAPDNAAGRKVKCPGCGNSLTIPNSDANEESYTQPFVSDRDRTKHRLKASSGSRKMVFVAASLAVVISLAALGAVLLGGKGGKQTDRTDPPAVPTTTGTPSATSIPTGTGSIADRDRDYFSVDEAGFEITGLLEGEMAWGRGAERAAWFDDLKGPEALLAVNAEFRKVVRPVQDLQLRKRKEFVEKYGVDSKTWKIQYLTRYPESEIIFDEIKSLAEEVCLSQRTDVSSHLVLKQKQFHDELSAAADKDPAINAQFARNGPKMIEDRVHTYRMEYLSKQMPGLIEKLRTKLTTMESITKLRAKVMSAR